VTAIETVSIQDGLECNTLFCNIHFPFKAKGRVGIIWFSYLWLYCIYF